ncbi:hypothetical protein BDN72DRAFT_160807 [Pluteus cervinus]|uniref:Uncharacterized protein n=1 Tax=Pluteus cervinus TaxID=181527 RepID=A0ACD3AJQ6_9AGAR|nr:hypothetical protein BDN72DRAFT_160807 [Pluteus cervinus]
MKLCIWYKKCLKSSHYHINQSDEFTTSSTFSEDDANQPQLVVEKRKSRIGCRLLAPTLILLTLSGGLATFLILWLTAIHGVDGQTLRTILDSRAFIANEGTNEVYGVKTARLLGLTISSATTGVVSLTAPFLVGLAGYCIAGMWLNEQENGSILLTPIQYGLLVKLLSVSGLASFFDGTRYLFIKSKNQAVAAPRLLTVAFSLAITVYSITHLISLADLWLHATSSAINYNITTYPQGLTLGYGALLQDDVLGCIHNVDGPRPHVQCPSLSYPPNLQADFAVTLNASTNFNISVPWSVNTLHDSQDLAVFVPHTSDPHLLWSAPSFGIRANCSNVTPQCSFSIDASFPYNCSTVSTDALLPQYSDDQDTSPIIDNALIFLDPNSGLSFLQFSWHLVNLSVANPFVNFDYRSRQASAFAICTVSLFNVTLSHAGDDSFVLRDADTKPFDDPYLTSTLLRSLQSTGMNQLADYLLPYAMFETNEANVIAALNQGFSRTCLGMNTYLFQDAAAQNFGLIQPTIVSRYSLVPVFVYVSLILIYSLIAIAIFIWASLIPTPVVKAPNGKEMTSLELTQCHLTDPMMIVASILHSQTGTPPEPKIGTNPVRLYAEDEQTPRLVVGIEGKSSADLGCRFRVREKARLMSNEDGL